MGLVARKLKQTVVFWGTPVPSGTGRSTFAAAVELDCRWEDKQELFIDADGEESLSLAVVYLAQAVDINGYLCLGEEADLDSDHSDPQVIAGAWVVRAVQSIPNLRASETLYLVHLGGLR